MKHITLLIILVALFYSLSCSKPQKQKPNKKEPYLEKVLLAFLIPDIIRGVHSQRIDSVLCKQKNKEIFTCTLPKTFYHDHVTISFVMKNDNGTVRLFHNSFELFSGESRIDVNKDIVLELRGYNTVNRQEWQRNYLLKTTFKDNNKY